MQSSMKTGNYKCPLDLVLSIGLRLSSNYIIIQLNLTLFIKGTYLHAPTVFHSCSALESANTALNVFGLTDSPL